MRKCVFLLNKLQFIFSFICSAFGRSKFIHHTFDISCNLSYQCFRTYWSLLRCWGNSSSTSKCRANNRWIWMRERKLINFLLFKCDKIHFATYNHEWYNLDPKDTKNLILLMIRCNKPFYLTAGKIFPMSMSTFCNVKHYMSVSTNNFINLT